MEALIDGKPLGPEAGADVVRTSANKTVVKINETRLYKIIQDARPETRTLELRAQKSELEAFTFTFG